MQFIDFALHPRWSISSLLAGAPDLANFQKPGFTFDRKESRARADWEFLKRLRDQWDGNLVAKGVTDVEDALRLRDEGIDAIQVSTHGGRQLDSAPPPILALKHIREAIGPEYPLFYDTGLRSGEDVIKAYHMGADFVFFGRAMQFAIAAGGREGLDRFWDLIAEEASLTLAQIGRTSLPGHPRN